MSEETQTGHAAPSAVVVVGVQGQVEEVRAHLVKRPLELAQRSTAGEPDPHPGPGPGQSAQRVPQAEPQGQRVVTGRPPPAEGLPPQDGPQRHQVLGAPVLEDDPAGAHRAHPALERHGTGEQDPDGFALPEAQPVGQAHPGVLRAGLLRRLLLHALLVRGGQLRLQVREQLLPAHCRASPSGSRAVRSRRAST